MKSTSHEAPTHGFDKNQVELAIGNNVAVIGQLVETRSSNRDELRAYVQAEMAAANLRNGGKQK